MSSIDSGTVLMASLAIIDYSYVGRSVKLLLALASIVILGVGSRRDPGDPGHVRV
jgi:hypothetical protein